MIPSLQKLLTGTLLATILLGGGLHLAHGSPGGHGYAFGAPGKPGAGEWAYCDVAWA